MERSSLLTALVMTLLGALASAQALPDGVAFARMNKPLRSATLDLATGVVTRGPVTHDRGGATVADFQNLDLPGFVGIDSGGGACKWFTAGLKGSGSNQSSNASDLMSSVVFSYCSAAKSVASGGPGGSVTLGFYEGYTVTGGATTTAIAVLALTGLPAHTNASSFLGSSSCYLLTVDFGNLVSFRDSGAGSHQGIGYSWTFDDLGMTSVWAATFPFFACMTSCSGSVGGTDGQGMTDAIDKYCPPGTAVPLTFSFGTTNPLWAPQTWTSVNMRIQEASDRLATGAGYNATISPNADTLTATAAIIGNTWNAAVVKAVPSAPSGFTVRVKTSRSLPNGTTPAPPATGRILIAGTTLGTFSGLHDGTTGSISAAIPMQLGFCGLYFTAQATTLGGGIKLSSAVEGTTGTM